MNFQPINLKIQVYVPESVPNDQYMGLIGRGTMAQANWSEI